ncbi:MAG: ParB/RepB/Spo0J family partition protein [Rickettsiaceae bacterium]|nr:ParB/RepB/Spo0J family partition protein [Rickettsiaceae bacterium]MCP5378528.1 ParB/RepB/Spo0J family partition protein [Rickettsiaceae bacterium]
MRIEKAKIRLPNNIKEENSNESSQRVSTYTESYKGEYYNIEVTKLIPFKNQSRKHFDQKSLEELASTIRVHGIRQPLTILPSSEQEGKYEIISGERRWKAAQIAGLTKVPCIIIHNQEAAEEIALIENIQRQNLHPLELMQAFQSLLDRKICGSTQEIATKLGINKSAVVEALSLKNLPNETQQVLLNEGVKARKVLRVLVKSTQDKHLKIINDYKKSIEKEQKKEVKSTEAKVLSIFINKGKVSFQDNKISSLSTKEKSAVKQSLVEFFKQINI